MTRLSKLEAFKLNLKIDLKDTKHAFPLYPIIIVGNMIQYLSPTPWIIVIIAVLFAILGSICLIIPWIVYISFYFLHRTIVDFSGVRKWFKSFDDTYHDPWE